GDAGIRTFGQVAGSFTLNDPAPGDNMASIDFPGNAFDANGQGQFTLVRSDPDTLPAGNPHTTITATSGAATGSTDAAWINATAVLTPTTATNLAGTAHTVTAHVQKNAADFAGALVNFQVTGVNSASGVGVTDASGLAHFTYTGIAGTPGVGTDHIRATTSVDGVLLQFPDIAEVTKNWVNPVCSATLNPPTNPKLVNQTVTVGVDVTDGNPAVPVGAGYATITFLITSGPNAGATFTGPTDATGHVDFTGYSTSTTAGTDVISITGSTAVGAVAFTCSISQQWITTGATLTPVTATNRVGTPHTLTATVAKDGIFQNGVSVTFTITGANAALSPLNATTNALGIANATYVGTVPGTDTITASGTVSGQPFTSNSATKNWIDPVCTGLLPATDTELVGTTQSVKATILRWAGGPAAAIGTPVQVQVTAGPNAGASGTVAISTPAGEATFSYTSNGLTGTDTIQATAAVDGVTMTTPCTATKTWVNTGCTLTPASSTDPVGAQHTATAKVLVNGAVAPVGTTVHFAVAGANVAAGIDDTDANGEATFTYTGNNPGTDTITASGTVIVGGNPLAFSCLATKKWVNVICSSAVDAPVSKVGTTAGITTTITINGGAPAPPIPIHFQVIAGPNVGNSGTANTVGNQAIFSPAYTSNGLCGTDVIQVTYTLDGSTFQCGNVNKKWINPSCSFDATTPGAINTPKTLTLTVFECPGVPAVGVATPFNVTGVNFASGPGNSPVTDATGKNTFTYIGTNSGTDTVTATVTVEGVPISPACSATQVWNDIVLNLTPPTATNQAGGSHTLTAEITNGGVAQQGIFVGFEIISGPNVGKTGVGVTNVLGRGTFTYSDDNGPGTDTIKATATVAGTTVSQTATKTWISVACSLLPATDTTQVGGTHTVTATVTSNGVAVNPDGNAVVFEILAGSPNVTGPTTRTTNLATHTTDFTYTGSGGTGTDTIQASGTFMGVPFTCTATQDWINASCSLAPNSETVVVGTPHSVTVTVLKNGSPSSGVLVSFDVTSGPNGGKSGTGTTNAAGQATFTYTGVPTAGTDSITASGTVSGVAFSCTAAKTWILDDSDGIPPDEENECIAGGDGNADGVLDSLQANVASFKDINGHCVTIESPVGTTLANVSAIDPPNPELAPPGVTFPYGFFSFEIHNVASGGGLDVKMYLHGGPTVNTYYKFGSVPIIPVDHYYRFLDDGTTGSDVNGDVITLHLTDGQRGDDDITPNGIIVEPGGPALEADNPAPITNPTCGACGSGGSTAAPLLIACLLLGSRSIRKRRRN
ncbi:MAG TPA: choice-of-anchor U domain-containing protein, partial [Phycisphaerae bacterium]|nr:choice-of-anchor U domain-containing protein [Phycisphaerae bacterium]